MYKRNTETRSWNHCCSGKAISIIQPECSFVALGIQHAMGMCHIVICDMPRSTKFFHIFSQTSRFSEKRYWTSNVCFGFLSNCCLKYFSFSEEMSEIWLKKYIGIHVKYPLSLSDFTETWIFATDFRKILKYQISWKSVQWEPSCSMRKGRRTDGERGGQTDSHDKANSRFSQFCEHA